MKVRMHNNDMLTGEAHACQTSLLLQAHAEHACLTALTRPHDQLAWQPQGHLIMAMISASWMSMPPP